MMPFHHTLKSFTFPEKIKKIKRYHTIIAGNFAGKILQKNSIIIYMEFDFASKGISVLRRPLTTTTKNFFHFYLKVTFNCGY